MTITPQVDLYVHDLDPRAIEVVDGRRLGDARTALDGALLSFRMAVSTQVKAELNQRTVVTGAELMKLLDYATQFFLPKYYKIVGPYTAQAYLRAYRQAGAGDVPVETIYALAQQHTERTGTYFAETSREAVQHGFTSFVNRKVPAKAAAEQVMDAYGLTKRQMNGYVSITPEGKILSAEPRSLKGRVREYIGRSIRSRLKLFDEQELRNIDSQAAQTAWIWLQQNGRIPATAQKVWLTARDERTCKQCAPMDNTRVDVNERFTMPNGTQLYVPGAHVNCRCQVRLLATVQPVSKADDWDPQEHPRGGDPENRGRFSRRRGPEVAEREDQSGFQRFLDEAERRLKAEESPRPEEFVATPKSAFTATPKQAFVPAPTQEMTSTPQQTQAFTATPRAHTQFSAVQRAEATGFVAKPEEATAPSFRATAKPAEPLKPALAPVEDRIVPLNDAHDYYYSVWTPHDGPAGDWDYTPVGKVFYSDLARAQYEAADKRRQLIEDKYNRATANGHWNTVTVEAIDPNTRQKLHGEVDSSVLMDALQAMAGVASGEIYYQELEYDDETVPVSFYDSDGNLSDDVDSISLADIAEQHQGFSNDFEISILAIKMAHNDPDQTQRMSIGDYRISGNYVQEDKSLVNDNSDMVVPVRFLKPYIRETPSG